MNYNGISEQTIDCQCQGNNPNCSLCDGKGYYYLSRNENKEIIKTEAEAHILDLTAVGNPKSEKKPSHEYDPVLKKNTKKGQMRNNKQDQKTGSDNFPGKKPEINKNRDGDKSIHSAALTVVKLELQKLKIEKGDNNQESVQNILRVKPKEINRPKNIPKPSIPKDIFGLASFLKLPYRTLIRYLNQNTIHKAGTDVLDESELSKITPYIEARLKALGRQEKRRLW